MLWPAFIPDRCFDLDGHRLIPRMGSTFTGCCRSPFLGHEAYQWSKDPHPVHRFAAEGPTTLFGASRAVPLLLSIEVATRESLPSPAPSPVPAPAPAPEKAGSMAWTMTGSIAERST